MILLVLAALVVRVDASPLDVGEASSADAASALDDARMEAIRYANILTGDEPEDDPALASRDLEGANEDADADDDADDMDDEELDDAADDGLDVPRGDPRLGDADGDGLGVPRGDPRLADADEDDRGEPGGDRRVGDDGELDLASVEDASSELSGTGHLAGELAMLEAGTTDSGAIVGEDVSFAAASAGAAETYESWMRHQRPSRWGRLDLGVSWRRRWSEPMSGMSRRYDELWLVATWRR